MKLFERKVKIGRPIAAPPPTGNVVFPGTNIFVQNSTMPGAGGQYAPTVLNHLQAIQTLPSGAQLIAAISGAANKKILIKYNGQNNNSAGGNILGYKKLRMHHDLQDNPAFGAELTTTLNQSGHDVQWLATECYQRLLPRWDGSTSPSPFRALRPPAPQVGQGAPGGQGAQGGNRPPNRPVPPTPITMTAQLINTWLAGNARPDRDEMDILCLVLEQWLDNGTGSGTLISYDPHKVMVAGVHRPPHVALVHELVHAYYFATGSQLGREDSLSETNGGRLFELMAVGLPPFDQRPISENQFRADLGVTARPSYP